MVISPLLQNTHDHLDRATLLNAFLDAIAATPHVELHAEPHVELHAEPHVDLIVEPHVAMMIAIAFKSLVAKLQIVDRVIGLQTTLVFQPITKAM
jgi:hypothetical protein